MATSQTAYSHARTENPYLDRSSDSIERMLLHLEKDLRARATKFKRLPARLIFQSPPDPLYEGQLSHLISTPMAPNERQLPLRAHDHPPENAAFLDHQAWLLETCSEVEYIPSNHPSTRVRRARRKILNAIQRELWTLEELKQKEWLRQRDVQRAARQNASGGIPLFDTTPILSSLDITHYPLYLICHLLVVVLNVICHVSIHRCNDFVLPTLQAILREQQAQSQHPGEVDVADGIPGSVQSIISMLGIQPCLRPILCCRECFACYPSDDPPASCTYRRAPDLPPCGHPLFTERKRKGRVVSEPERMLNIQDFRHWLGQLLCRPGMEEILDRDVYDTGARDGQLLDIWDGEVLRNFRGPDGTRFVSRKPSKAGKLELVFDICMDNFNPFFNKAGGKSYSAGAITLICLNLPPGMRHLLENIFVFCVFPGPREPQLDDINNILCFLTEAFLDFWQPGVYYSRTPRYPGGRLVNAAIVPLIADLLAARKMSGIFCWCTQCKLAARDVDNIDERTWPEPLTGEEHRRLAEEWKSLDSKSRDSHFKKHGIRWSELLRLPYWDPVLFTVVEFSHNLLGVNVQHHLRTVFGMNVNAVDGLGEAERTQKKAEVLNPLQIEDAWMKVLHGEDQKIQQLPAKLLKECCRLAGLPYGGRHGVLLDTLRKWRTEQGVANDDGSPQHPLKKPTPTDPPSELEVFKGESTFARATNKKAMHRVKKNVIEEMVLRRTRRLEGERPASANDMDDDGSLLAESDSWQSSDQASVSSSASTSSRASLASSTKGELIDMLYELRIKEDPVEDTRGSNTNAAILGRNTLAIIHQDLQKMSLPSWIGRVPSDLGSARHGTLSHDALRTVSTVILPSSLTRLWGLKPEDSRERQILENYLDMSTATTIALLRTSSVEDADEFHRLWLRYLQGLRRLYPYLGRVPSQHISLHLSANIKNFGPAPGQHTNVCERINFLLQKTPTNSKSGEMEMTMLSRFCMAQNIRTLIKSLPSHLQVVTQSFTNAFDSDGRGTLQEEIGGHSESKATFENVSKTTELPDDLYTQLLQKHRGMPFRRALMQTHIDYRRKRYSTRDHSMSESFIAFRDDKDAWRGGQITDIIVQRDYSVEEPQYKTWIAVQKFSTLRSGDARHDPYLAQNRDTGLGCLCYVKPRTPKVLIGVEDIVCHTMCHANHFPGISEDVMHMMPLLRE